MIRNPPLTWLRWLGRQGTRGVAATILIGIAFPPLGTLLRPFLTEAVFILLCIAFMRVEPTEILGHLRRPFAVLAATLWTAVIVPALFGLVCMMFAVDSAFPEVYLGLMMQGVASPMMAAPAFAMLMGLDATLVLLALIGGTMLLPLTASAYAWLFFDGRIGLSPVDLGSELFLILFGSAAVGLLLRRIMGLPRVNALKDEIDGISILTLVVFAAAVMRDVAASVIDAPLLSLTLLALATGTFAASFGVSVVVFSWLGRRRALAIGFMSAQRNLGLMFAATGGSVPELTWLYFAFYQFPVYLSPVAVQRWVMPSKPPPEQI